MLIELDDYLHVAAFARLKRYSASYIHRLCAAGVLAYAHGSFGKLIHKDAVIPAGSVPVILAHEAKQKKQLEAVRRAMEETNRRPE